ncbi:MAG: protoporphyrinogen oxidase HemJ [Dongiaceae bacterium]
MDWLDGFYPWLKAFHIVGVIAWMAGLLYLPRLFVYHAEAAVGSPQSETFKVMERRLLRGIMNPAMGAAYIFGILVLLTPEMIDNWRSGWFHAKVGLIVALTIYHHALARWRKGFATDANKRPPRFYRLMNEVPTAILVAIVILVVVKPF